MKLVTAIFTSKTSRLFIGALLMLTITTFTFGREASMVTAPPVFWNVFSAEAKNNSIVLKWVVTEYNNKAFYIQHSLNGSDWRDIDSISSKKSALSLDEYSYTHKNNLEGRQYYRLRHIDGDLSQTGYSEVVTVMLRRENQNKFKQGISFSPNPATDEVRIINEEGSEKFYSKATIFDLSGKIVAEKKLESHTNTITVKELPVGIYLVRAEHSDGSSVSQKIVKQ